MVDHCRPIGKRSTGNERISELQSVPRSRETRDSSMARGFHHLFLALILLTSVAAARAQTDATGLSAFPALSAETDWPWWRGPSRNGVASDSASVPVRFGESENVLWRAPVPGRGHSSPIVVGDRVFLATAD